MKIINKTSFAFSVVCFAVILLILQATAASPLYGQSGRRVIELERKDKNLPTDMSNTAEVRYEGGMIGGAKAMKGRLILDGSNNRILFKDGKGSDLFSFPFAAVIAAYPDVRKKTPFLASAAANAVPYGGGLPALLIKRKARYLVIHYKELDTDLQGVVTFKFKRKEQLVPNLEVLVRESNLTKRENIYVRLKRDRSGTR